MKKKRTFIIAEIGNNHEGNFQNAKKMIFNAYKAGVDAVKFQKKKMKKHTLDLKNLNYLIKNLLN